MRIQYCSDLHLEFRKNGDFLHANPLAPSAEILVLAGDIIPLTVLDKHQDFISFVSDNFKEVYWIPGNHEYYNYDIGKMNISFVEDIRKNVHLINNHIVIIDNVTLIFSTLWTHINPQNEGRVHHDVSDFYVIKINGKLLTPSYYNMMHSQSLAFLKSALADKRSGDSMVITHHVPTLLNYPEKYKNPFKSFDCIKE